MDFELSEQQRAIKDTARAFAHDEMMPLARQWDEEGGVPAGTLRRAAGRGGGGGAVPAGPSAGGGGARLRPHLRVRRSRRFRAVAARRRADLRGVGAGL